MISIERALSSIRGKSTEEVREFARNRILGTDVASFGSGHSAEPSEDVVIQLLEFTDLDAGVREAIVEGWMDVYEEVGKWLLSRPDYIENIGVWKDMVVNLCRVVDIAEPPEFKKYVKRLISGLLDEESCPGEFLGAAVKAYMAYAQDETSIRFWEEEILTKKDVAAYGFNALLDIDVQNPGIATDKKPTIEKYLCDLWPLQITEDWPVNTAFLLRRAARVRNETSLIYRVLLRLKNRDGTLWERVEKELEEPWGQQWLEKLTGFEETQSQKHSQNTFAVEFVSTIGKSGREYLKYPEVEFKHRDGEDQLHYGYITIRSGMFHTDWVRSLERFMRVLENKGKIKSVGFENELEEIENVS